MARGTLYCFMNGQQVGVLEKSRNGALSFTYDENWNKSNKARPISLSMPLSQNRYAGDIVENYFNNLLPDNTDLRTRIQRRFQADSNRPFDLLWHIGRDCVGALQITEDPENAKNVYQITGREVDENEIEKHLANYQTMLLGMSEVEDFRISIAGAQEKTGLLYLNGQWLIPTGSTPTTHIIKLPIGRIEAHNMDLSDSVINEHICLEIMRQFALPVADTQPAFFGKQEALIVQRFDRAFAKNDQWIIRLPQEDFCQALGFSPGLKYQKDGGPGIKEITELLGQTNDPINERYRFMKTVLLFWIMGAIDGHAKNFSLHLGPKGAVNSTPVYDVMSAYPLVKKKQMGYPGLKMAMAVRGSKYQYKWGFIRRDHWPNTAEFANIGSELMESAIEECLEQFENALEQTLHNLPDHPGAEMNFNAIKEGMERAIARLKP